MSYGGLLVAEKSGTLISDKSSYFSLQEPTTSTAVDYVSYVSGYYLDPRDLSFLSNFGVIVFQRQRYKFGCI